MIEDCINGEGAITIKNSNEKIRKAFLVSLNLKYEDILITANISHGNSGGPLVDNEGLVVGTNTFSAIGEQYNGSKSLDSMCAKIIKCDGK